MMTNGQPHRVVSYLGKYVFKAEQDASALTKQLNRALNSAAGDDKPAASALQSALVKTVAGRQVSAAEAALHIMGEPLFVCSDAFVNERLAHSAFIPGTTQQEGTTHNHLRNPATS